MSTPSFMDMIKSAKNMQKQMASAKNMMQEARISGKSGSVEIISDGLHNPVEIKGAGDLGPDISKALLSINEQIQALSQQQIQTMSNSMDIEGLEGKE